jgi:hypothetical protein
LVSLGVSYPVAIDNDFRIWRAFDNVAWPALYFIGADGHIRRHVFGEGEYDQSEQLIQQLLSEADAAPIAGGMVAVNGISTEAAPDERDLRSPETYIGYAQATNFASPGFVGENASRVYKTLSARANTRCSMRHRAELLIVFTPVIFNLYWPAPRKVTPFAFA